MARKSKLTDKQWEAIGKRYLAGENIRALGREFGVSDTAIRLRFASRSETIKTVANQIVAADNALKSLPLALQCEVINFADQLKSVSGHLLGAANFGAATAHRLSGIAHGKVLEIDDASPMDAQSIESLKGIAVLTRMANDAASTGLNLLSANAKESKSKTEDTDNLAAAIESARKRVTHDA